MLACLCNHCRFISPISGDAKNCLASVWRHLLDTIFINQKDRFTDCDGDTQIGSESIFTIISHHFIISFVLTKRKDFLDHMKIKV